MVVGHPPGNYDRLLDVSKAVTGSLYFVPPPSFLDDVATEPSTGDGAIAPADEPPAETQTPSPLGPSLSAGSLRIGSMKDEAGHQ